MFKKKGYSRKKRHQKSTRQSFDLMMRGLLLIVVCVYAYLYQDKDSEKIAPVQEDPLRALIQNQERDSSDSLTNASHKTAPPVVTVPPEQAMKKHYPSDAFCNLNLSSDQPIVDEKLISNDTYTLCYKGFATVYKGSFRVSLMSAEHLTAQRVREASQQKRAQAFVPDPILKTLYRKGLDRSYVLSKDYIAHKKYRDHQGTCSSYHTCDRGHLSPSSDMNTVLSREQSNYFSNVVPQSSEANRGIWSQMEHIARCAAIREGDIYVVNLPIYQYNAHMEPQERLFIGKGRGVKGPAVPAFMAKIIYNPKQQYASVYIIENTPRSKYDLISLKQLNSGRFLGGDIGALYIEPFPNALRSNWKVDPRLPNPKHSASVSEYCNIQVR